MRGMEVKYLDVLNELYDLFVEKIESKFNLDEYSSNYTKYDGSLTLFINNKELYVEFGRCPTIIINFWQKDQVTIPLEYEDGEWKVRAYSDWNSSEKPVTFDEGYLNRVLRHFEYISK